MIPVRVQRKRTRGWKMPPNTVCVDRKTKWGNPFAIGETFIALIKPNSKTDWQGDGFWDCNSVEETITDNKSAVENFTQLLLDGEIEFFTEKNGQAKKHLKFAAIEEIKEGLKGKNLACWCKPGDPCHADVLLKLANPIRGRNHEGIFCT